jgi:hypothetical protein
MEDLKYIRNMLDEEIERMEKKEREKEEHKNESIKVLEKDVNKLIYYTVHDFLSGYGIKKQKDIIKNLLNITINQSERINNLENKITKSKEKI